MKRYLIYSMIVFVAALSMVSCRQRPIEQDKWGQGYEQQQGQQQVYMEPDHSFMYYWLMYHIFFSNNVQPTYHVYQPPAGYPSNFRPWMDPSPYQPKTVYTPPTRTDWGSATGGFSTPSPTYTPDFSSSSGGFSSPSFSSSSGGFSSGGSSSSTYSSSGGGFSGK